ncbi:MAG: ATP-binding protein [Bacteroidales bacterium]|jgi:predicted AAA+ superfamily ATPase|nr:ATP-binding protein [Bacteroidales bacterium]
MYRVAIKQLIKWKLSEDKKPLVLLGARQVGKTYLLQDFGRREYRQMVYINFERADEMREIFKHDLDPKRLITNFEFYSGLKITPEDTLIVLDEIQAAPRGITSLKYFCEEVPEYQIIAAGSLLGINVHPDESFPVGKVDFLTLHPMSFYEFLLAMDEENGVARILKEKQWDNISFFSQKLKELLKYYFYVGGMPEAVLAFAQNRDWKKARSIQNKILTTYRNDFSKHAPKDVVPRINMVWDSMPSQLSKENKKFIYGVIKEGARAKDFELAIQWLTDAGLLHKVYNISKPGIPLIAYQELSAFKLFHNDIGLLGAMSNLKARTIVNGDALFTEYKGALTEQYVFQQLNLLEDFPVYYFSPNTQTEIDFIVQNEDDEIIPIEVKAEENLRAKSLKAYCEKNKPRIAIRTSLAQYKKESWMTNVPLYVIGEYFNNGYDLQFPDITQS